jgi:hypothetical protein
MEDAARFVEDAAGDVEVLKGDMIVHRLTVRARPALTPQVRGVPSGTSGAKRRTLGEKLKMDSWKHCDGYLNTRMVVRAFQELYPI